MSMYDEDEKSGINQDLSDIKSAYDKGKNVYDKGKKAYEKGKELTNRFKDGKKGLDAGGKNTPNNGKAANEELKQKAASKSADAQRRAAQAQQASQRAAALSKATVAEKSSEAAAAGAATAQATTAASSGAAAGSAAAAGGAAGAGAGAGGSAVAVGGPVVWIVVAIAVLILVIALLFVILFAGVGGFFMNISRAFYGKDVTVGATAEERVEEEEYGFEQVVEPLSEHYKDFYERVENEKKGYDVAKVFYDYPDHNAFDTMIVYGGVSMDMANISVTKYDKNNPFNLCNMKEKCNINNLAEVFNRMMTYTTYTYSVMLPDGSSYSVIEITIHNIKKEDYIEKWFLGELGLEQVKDFDKGIFDGVNPITAADLSSVALGTDSVVHGYKKYSMTNNGKDSNDYVIDYDLETGRTTVKYVASGEKKEFIETIGNAAVNAWKTSKTKILPSLTIAQAIVESNWGKSDLSKYELNFFGEKWHSGSSKKHASYWTREENRQGESDYVLAKFVSYDTFDEAMLGRLDYFKNSSYFGDVIGCTDYTEAIKILCGKNKYGARYATDLEYAQTILDIIEGYELYKYDELAMSEEGE